MDRFTNPLRGRTTAPRRMHRHDQRGHDGAFGLALGGSFIREASRRVRNLREEISSTAPEVDSSGRLLRVWHVGAEGSRGGMRGRRLQLSEELHRPLRERLRSRRERPPVLRMRCCDPFEFVNPLRLLLEGLPKLVALADAVLVPRLQLSLQPRLPLLRLAPLLARLVEISQHSSVPTDCRSAAPFDQMAEELGRILRRGVGVDRIQMLIIRPLAIALLLLAALLPLERPKLFAQTSVRFSSVELRSAQPRELLGVVVSLRELGLELPDLRPRPRELLRLAQLHTRCLLCE